MADLRTSISILEDSATGAGLPLHKVLAGDTSVAKNALAGLVATDSGNLMQYLKVNAARELVISTSQGDVAHLDGQGSVAGSAIFVDVASIPLTIAKTYKNVGFVAGCTRDALFKIIQIDDVTTTILVQGIDVINGHAMAELLQNLEFVAGGSGTQTLKIQAKNLNSLSDFRATLTVDEVQ